VWCCFYEQLQAVFKNFFSSDKDLDIVRYRSAFCVIRCSPVVLQATKPCNEASQNSTIRNFALTRPIITKLSVIDYVCDPYWYANFSWIWLGAKFPANRSNITSMWLFVVSLFRGLAWRKTRERIGTINDFKTREFIQGCAFWEFRPKILPPPELVPTFHVRKIVHYKSRFSLRKVWILAEAPAKFVFE